MSRLIDDIFEDKNFQQELSQHFDTYLRLRIVNWLKEGHFSRQQQNDLYLLLLDTEDPCSLINFKD